MDGYTGEEEDAAVQVEVKQETHQPAHEVSKNPMVTHHIAGHEERQREAVHQIRGGQIDHVDQRSVPLTATPAPVGPKEDGGVQDEAEQEGQGVAQRQDDVLVGLVNAAAVRCAVVMNIWLQRYVGDGSRGLHDQLSLILSPQSHITVFSRALQFNLEAPHSSTFRISCQDIAPRWRKQRNVIYFYCDCIVNLNFLVVRPIVYFQANCRLTNDSVLQLYLSIVLNRPLLVY